MQGMIEDVECFFTKTKKKNFFFFFEPLYFL